MKLCIECLTKKPLGDFYIKKTGRPQSRCIPCHKLRVRHYRGSLRADKPEEFLRRNRERHLKRRYGITLADMNEGIVRQSNRCPICLREKVRFVIDHCHLTGVVRGFPCHECNSGMGVFRDDPLRLRAAAKYLEKASKQINCGSSVLTRKV